MLYPIELRARFDVAGWPAMYRIPNEVRNAGGEERIRTSGPVLPGQPLSRRLPSANSATSPNLLFGGGSRIRTHGAFALRFSRPAPSTTRPSLRAVWHKALRRSTLLRFLPPELLEPRQFSKGSQATIPFQPTASGSLATSCVVDNEGASFQDEAPSFDSLGRTPGSVDPHDTTDHILDTDSHAD